MEISATLLKLKTFTECLKSYRQERLALIKFIKQHHGIKEVEDPLDNIVNCLLEQLYMDYGREIFLGKINDIR
jgi:hypothetical protein